MHRPPPFPGNQKDPNHSAWAELWDWVDTPLRQVPPPPARAPAAAVAVLAAPNQQHAWPDDLQQDPVQAIGGATAAAVAHPPAGVKSAVDQLRTVACRATDTGEPTNWRLAAEAAGSRAAPQTTLADDLQPQRSAASADSDEAAAASGMDRAPCRRRLGLARRSSLSPQGSGASSELPPAASLHAAALSSSDVQDSGSSAAFNAGDSGPGDVSSPEPCPGAAKARSSFRRFMRPQATPEPQLPLPLSPGGGAGARDDTAFYAQRTATGSAAAAIADSEAAASSQQSPPPAEGQARQRPSLRRLLHRRASGLGADATAAESPEPGVHTAQYAVQAGAGPPAERTARIVELRRISTESASDASSERPPAGEPSELHARNGSNGSLSKLNPDNSSTPPPAIPSAEQPLAQDPEHPAREPDGGRAPASARSSSDDSGALLAMAAAASPEAAADAGGNSPAISDSAAALLPTEQETQPGSLRMRFATPAAEADAGAAAAEPAVSADVQRSVAAEQDGDATAVAAEPQPPSAVLEIWESVKQSALSPGGSCMLSNLNSHVDIHLHLHLHVHIHLRLHKQTKEPVSCSNLDFRACSCDCRRNARACRSRWPASRAGLHPCC